MRTPPPFLSLHNPRHIRAALVQAAHRRDYEAIDRITDEAVRAYPEMFVPRGTSRPEFGPKDRLVIPKL